MKHRTMRLADLTRGTNSTDHRDRQADEKLEKLEDQFRRLETELSVLKGALSVLGLILTVVTGLGGWRLYESRKFEAARSDVYANLVSQLREQTSDAVNKLTVTEGPPDQKRRIEELTKLNQALTNLKIVDEKLSNTGELVRALKHLVIENNRKAALNTIASLANMTSADPFIRARAITLRELILISANRNEPPATSRKNLLEAIRLDGTVALAFNGLGIVSTADARRMLSAGNLEQAMRLMDEAAIEYKMAADLDSSSLGTYKGVNNRIWSVLLIIKWCLERGPRERAALDQYLSRNNYRDLDAFFDGAEDQLQQYEPLSPDLPVASETTAQILFVRALSNRSRGNHGDSDAMIRKGFETFLKAIDGGLYRRVATREAAKTQFDEDYLHSDIARNPDYADVKRKIHERIDDWYSKNDQ
jgi:hypothetical protein